MQPEAEIHLGRLRENYQYLKSLVGDARVMAVVKANAYGHGTMPVAAALADEGVHGFCVAHVNEVNELINGGITLPILHVGRFSAADLPLFRSGQVRCTINSPDDLKLIHEFSSENGVIITAHLKVDTGMGRMGIRFEEAEFVMQLLAESSSIKIEGIYSHFATAEEKDTQYRDWQLERFHQVVTLAKELLPKTQYFHIANSAGILTYPESHFNMVRPGITLYGISPLGEPHDHLKPVMTLMGKVVLKKQVKAGEYIGYNRLYRAEKDEQTAMIQMGYADGIPVEMSNFKQVEIKGKYYPILGKVSMDLICVGIGGMEVDLGDDAIFWGSSLTENRVENLSQEYSKNPYEFLTGVSKRVERVYLDD